MQFYNNFQTHKINVFIQITPNFIQVYKTYCRNAFFRHFQSMSEKIAK